MVLDQIYGRSNFAHKFCLLATLAKFMVKILGTINLIQDHKWPKPVYSHKL